MTSPRIGLWHVAQVPLDAGPPLSISFICVVRFFNKLSRSSPPTGFAGALFPPAVTGGLLAAGAAATGLAGAGAAAGGGLYVSAGLGVTVDPLEYPP